MRRSHRVAAALAATVALVVGGVTQSASADDLSHKRSQLEQQIAQQQQAQKALQASIEDMSGQLAQTASDLQNIQAQIPVAQQKLDDATATLAEAQRAQQEIADQLADAQNQQTQISQQITDGQTQQSNLRDAVGAMAREAYRSGGDVSGLSVVLDAQSTSDFVDSYTMIAAAQRAQEQVFGRLADLQAQARNDAARLASVKQKITELKQAADQKVTEANQAKKDAADAKAQLDNLQQQAQAKQASLQSQIADAKQQDAAMQASTAQIQSDLQKIIAQQAAQAAAKKSTVTPGKALPGAWFANPTANNPIVVTSEFGMRLQPVLHIYRLHAGIDLMDHCNQPVYAGRDGTVIWSKYLAGYGNQVMLDHGWVNGASLMSSYSHLNRYVVGPGQHVTAGQVIGYAGMTGGDSTGCHLHFEVHINGVPVNPRSPYLGLPPL
jgi:murein DD-endopeptidase MepM/ murein hydrolase activator NlpD